MSIMILTFPHVKVPLLYSIWTITDTMLRTGRQRMRWLNSITDLNRHEFEQAPVVGDGQGRKPGMLQSLGWQRVGHDWATELNWLNWLMLIKATISLKCAVTGKEHISLIPTVFHFTKWFTFYPFLLTTYYHICLYQICT